MSMNRFRRILAGVDLASGSQLVGSELTAPNRQVIQQAMTLAAESEAELCLYSVLDVSDTMQRLLDEQRGRRSNVFDEAYQVLQRCADEMAHGGVKPEIVVGMGSSWQRLIERVGTHQHDLLIVGTRDVGPLQRILYGSTAMKVLRYCPCPVLVTRPPIDDGKAIVLVAHDLTELGDRALELGASLAHRSGGILLIFHAFETTPHHGLAGSEVTVAEAAIRTKLAEDDLRTSMALIGRLPRHEIILREGKPALELLQVLETRDVDLMVMGTRARTGLGGFFIGNTAERLLPELRCSVLAIKRDDYVCPLSFTHD
jgi:universal stress protein E